MSEGNGNQPIIIVKKKGGHGGHHGGAWKVAYADFVTAMMALFIVLWILGQSDAVKEAVAHYFNDPTGFSSKSSGVIGSGKKNSGKKNPGDGETLSWREIEEKKFAQMKSELEEELQSNSTYMSLGSQVEIQVANEGLRIELIDNGQNIFFDLGSSHLKPQAENLLQHIGHKLSQIDNPIVIEGHTDSRKFVRQDNKYTNFELSADRANAARRALLEGGLDVNQIDEIRGYADRRLRDPEHPTSFVNRRTSIIIKYSEKK
ncbi:MAG: chemotaxis protein MotB [Ignavibacteria bacterium]|nr:MAG: chemotaxis protein MotB [Ignavibacteria bacterium]